MAQFTIPQYIFFGEATVFLMQNYQADGALYGRRLINRASPVMVAIVTDILKWQYEINVAAALENITITKLVSESGKILVTQITSKQIIKE
jgi:hypothetical protein